MKPCSAMTPAEQAIFRISEVRDLCLALSKAGEKAGLHSRKRPFQVRESLASFKARKGNT